MNKTPSTILKITSKKRMQWHCLPLLLMISLCICRPAAVHAQAIKGKTGRTHTVRLNTPTQEKRAGQVRPVVAFLGTFPLELADAQTLAAYEVLRQDTTFSSIYITQAQLEKQKKTLRNVSVLWIHSIDPEAARRSGWSETAKERVKTYLTNGGNLFLSMQAAHLVRWLGIDTTIMSDSLKPCGDKGYGRRLGFHAFRDHPVFEGLNGGTYVQIPQEDIVTPVTGYFRDTHPYAGKVVAVDWDYIFLRENSKLVTIYYHGAGKTLAAGAYLDYLLPNRNEMHLKKFTRNCLRYLAAPTPPEGNYWNYESPAVTRCPDSIIPRGENHRPAPAISWPDKESELTLKKNFATRDFYDLAGERILIMGSQQGGIDEIWSHPFMSLQDYQAGIRFSYKDTIFWLQDERPEISVQPSEFSRLYRFPRAYLKEVIVADPINPAGVVHYEYRGIYEAELVIRFRSSLRWMWPYSEKVTGPVCYSADEEAGWVMFRDRAGDLCVMAGANRKPSSIFAGQYKRFEYQGKAKGFLPVSTDKPELSTLMSWPLGMNDNLDVVISATVEGIDSAARHFGLALENPLMVRQSAEDHVRELFNNSLMLTTPDQNFNRGYRWALVSTDRFFVHTPGMGKALTAGYSTTKKGWDGGHGINGRPGYGWYFGRDAQWSGLALLDYGDFDKVRSQLSFFNKYQDLTGKIFHEASTSGLIHYDAADATPLYIVLAGRYFRHSYDTAFIRETWPFIKNAIRFCFSTDSDQDKLIENTNVGHGWVEGGKLFGSHSTIYMAGSWGAALREAATMGDFMKDPDAALYKQEVQEQYRLINTLFWNDKNRFFSHGMDKDKTFREVQTILPAVPVYFRMTDLEKSIICNYEYAGNAFSTNWGVRILREDHPWFRPTGYHYGSVWPLFTGWASLSAYTVGNGINGFTHMMNNLNIYKNWGLGFAEEVLNGSVYEPSGVCPHQCWSETMVLQPAIEGMLGLKVDATYPKLVLAPNIPAHWDSLIADNIRFGTRRISFSMYREDTATIFHFKPDHGESLRMEFMPYFPAGTHFGNILMDGKKIPGAIITLPDAMNVMLAFELTAPATLTVPHTSGISLLPAIRESKPGDTPEGLRILSSRLSGNTLTAIVEGLSNTIDEVKLWSTTPATPASGNLVLKDQNKRVSGWQVTFSPSEKKYITETLIWKLNADHAAGR